MALEKLRDQAAEIAEVEANGSSRARRGDDGDSGSNREDLSFANISLWGDDAPPVTVPVPGYEQEKLPDGTYKYYIKVKSQVDFAVSAGRSRFAENIQEFESDGKGRRRPANKMRVTYDPFGLFLYKCEHCIADWALPGKSPDKPERMEGRPTKTRQAFARIKSDRFCEWVIEQIDHALGWDKEGEEDRESFPGSTEGRD